MQGRRVEMAVEKKKAAEGKEHTKFVRSGNGFYIWLYTKICLANLILVLVDSIQSLFSINIKSNFIWLRNKS